MSPRVAFETLGCKLNQYETDAMAAAFLELGWQVVDPSEPAEAYVINTCTVTNKADRKSRNTLGHHRTHPQRPVVVVTGCFAESSRASLEGQQGISYVVPNNKKNQIPLLVDSHHRGELARLPEPDPFGFPAHEKVFHTRASLKIQDGCDNFCSFCIIPSVRGRATSRPLAETVQAAQSLISAGRKELVLTGVNMGRWMDGTSRFPDLVRAILSLEGDFRVRITSLEPDGLGGDFVSLLDHPKFSPHLHLCLQSGSPRVLLAMRREYNREQYADLVSRCRTRRPDLNLTTDLIVGFPGETEADFLLSLGAIEEFGFRFVHCFPYSRRQGTRAERMPEQVPDEVKADRAQRIHLRVSDMRHRHMLSLLGQKRTVLVETPDQGRSTSTWLRGLSEDYFPVKFHGPARWNTFASVTLESVVQEGSEWVFQAR